MVQWLAVTIHATSAIREILRQGAGPHQQPTHEHRTCDIGDKNCSPQSQRVQHVLVLVKDEYHRIKRVLSEELRAADDDDNETDGIKRESYELCRGTIAQVADGQGDPQPGKPHADAACQAGKE
jgi:hypothetical protein